MNNKSVLYIAFHYPPILGSSGVLRSLAFTRHLADNGWHTVVLSVSLKSYQSWSSKQLSMLPQNVEVIRAFARNSAISFSLKGKYFSFMAQPDNWQSWIVGGFIRGLAAIFKKKPSVIVSTYPIASAHIIGYFLHRVTGIPWVADFRDPMAQEGYPANRTTRKIFDWVERKAVAKCQRIIVTTKGTQALYRNRFPEVNPDIFTLIPNGYDAVAFEGLIKTPRESDKLVLLHSGVVYPSERDPRDFFNALVQLKQAGLICAERIEIRLRATGHDELYKPMLRKLGIDDIVSLLPIVPYQQALQEMLNVDGLILMQAENCNFQVPAKAYEYIRADKPILGLMPLEGDTGQLLAELPQSYIAPLDDSEEIGKRLMAFLDGMNNQKSVDSIDIEQYSRQHQAKIFEQMLTDASKEAVSLQGT